MRGSPLLRLLLVLGGLALLALPVWRITGNSVPTREIPAKLAESPEDLADYQVLLTASSPARLQAKAGTCAADAPTNAARSMSAIFSMNANEPEDIAVFADFEERSAPSALRVEVKRGGEVLVEKTFWGTGVVEDVVMIPAK